MLSPPSQVCKIGRRKEVEFEGLTDMRLEDEKFLKWLKFRKICHETARK